VENGPFIDDFPIKTSIYKGFSMAMSNNQMVQFLWEPWYSILEPKPHLRWTYWWDATGETRKVRHLAWSQKARVFCGLYTSIYHDSVEKLGS